MNNQYSVFKLELSFEGAMQIQNAARLRSAIGNSNLLDTALIRYDELDYYFTSNDKAREHPLAKVGSGQFEFYFGVASDQRYYILTDVPPFNDHLYRNYYDGFYEAIQEGVKIDPQLYHDLSQLIIYYGLDGDHHWGQSMGLINRAFLAPYMQHAWYIEDRAKQQVGYQRIPQMVRVVPVDTSHEKAWTYYRITPNRSLSLSIRN